MIGSYQALDGLLEHLALPGQLLLSLLSQLPFPLHLSLLSQQRLVLAHHQLHLHTSTASDWGTSFILLPCGYHVNTLWLSDVMWAVWAE